MTTTKDAVLRTSLFMVQTFDGSTWLLKKEYTERDATVVTLGAGAGNGMAVSKVDDNIDLAVSMEGDEVWQEVLDANKISPETVQSIVGYYNLSPDLLAKLLPALEAFVDAEHTWHKCLTADVDESDDDDGDEEDDDVDEDVNVSSNVC